MTAPKRERRQLAKAELLLQARAERAGYADHWDPTPERTTR